jgi:hypothetical protein
MTLVGMFSLKGAPGVTTLSCLVAATWPGSGPSVVVEADPAGGDLAGRFGLSSTLGWPSLSSAVRRSGSATLLRPHLQYLPGGLPVLVSGRPEAAEEPRPDVVDLVERESAGGLVVVDLGRAPSSGGSPGTWLERCDTSILVIGGDAASALHARSHAARLSDLTGGRLALVVVGPGSRDSTEIGTFTGIRALGDVPFDPRSAAVASGASGAARRLARSALLASARRLADRLADHLADHLADQIAPDVRRSGESPGPAAADDREGSAGGRDAPSAEPVGAARRGVPAR